MYAQHYDDTEIEPDLVGIYGPVPTKALAEDLAATLAEAVPEIDGLTRYTVMPTHPVTLSPSRVDSAAVA